MIDGQGIIDRRWMSFFVEIRGGNEVILLLYVTARLLRRVLFLLKRDEDTLLKIGR